MTINISWISWTCHWKISWEICSPPKTKRYEIYKSTTSREQIQTWPSRECMNTNQERCSANYKHLGSILVFIQTSLPHLRSNLLLLDFERVWQTLNWDAIIHLSVLIRYRVPFWWHFFGHMKIITAKCSYWHYSNKVNSNIFRNEVWKKLHT
jgi:hypothetical protein